MQAIIAFILSLFGVKPAAAKTVAVQAPAPAPKPASAIIVPIKTSSDAFKKAFVKAMKWETGLRIDMNDPEVQKGLINTPAQRKKVGYTDGKTGHSAYDSGGETKFGYAQNAHRDRVVRDMTLNDAIDGYKRQYWDAVRGDELHPMVASYTFDIACNSGPSRGIKILQEACGVEQDGAIGPATLRAANAIAPATLVENMRAIRCEFLRGIVRRKPDQARFLAGWLNRANDI
jgi:hypothetical protein